jgi:hypothetical protein
MRCPSGIVDGLRGKHKWPLLMEKEKEKIIHFLSVFSGVFHFQTSLEIGEMNVLLCLIVT